MSHSFIKYLSHCWLLIGRLLYTTGDVAGAVRLFLGLLRGSSLKPLASVPEMNGDAEIKMPSPDGIFLEDFRVALTVSLIPKLRYFPQLNHHLSILTRHRIKTRFRTYICHSPFA